MRGHGAYRPEGRAIGASSVRRIAALLLALPALALPTLLLAQNGVRNAAAPVPGASLAEERAALAHATAQAEAARHRGEALEARAARATAAADRARDQSAALAARIQQSEADLRAGEARLAILAAARRDQAHRLAQRQQPIARLTAALQQIASRAPILALLEPGSVNDAVHRRIVLAQALPVIMARTRDLRAELARSADLRRSMQAANDRLRHLRDNLTDQRIRLAAAETRLRVAARQLHETAGDESERALAMGEQARDISDLLGRIEAAGTVREALMQLPGPTLRPAAPEKTALPGATAAPAPAGLAAAPTGRPPDYRLPVVGALVSGFGETSGSGLRSRGLTIATAPEAVAVAPAAGRVAFAGPFKGYGQILIIEHGGGWTSLIANLARLSARVGDELRAGDPIGSAGPGHPQILLELRKGDEPVDIAGLMG